MLSRGPIDLLAEAEHERALSNHDTGDLAMSDTGVVATQGQRQQFNGHPSGVSKKAGLITMRSTWERCGFGDGESSLGRTTSGQRRRDQFCDQLRRWQVRSPPTPLQAPSQRITSSTRCSSVEPMVLEQEAHQYGEGYGLVIVL